MKTAFALLVLSASVFSVSLGGGGDKIYISKVKDFIKFSEKVNNGDKYTSTTVYLKSSLDFKGESVDPIGRDGNPFCGTFDGQGHTIKNIKISSSGKYVGLFGYTEDATIKNVIIDRSCILTSTGDDELNNAGICGLCKGSCTIEGCINKADITANRKIWIGGILGRYINDDSNKMCTLSNNINYGTLNYTGLEKEAKMGGIIGESNGNITIKECSNFGHLINKESGTHRWTGGIVGYCSAQQREYVLKNSVNYGTITYTGTYSEIDQVYIGGIVGESKEYLHIKECTNFGEINTNFSNSKGWLGGIVGVCTMTSDAEVIEDSLNYGDIVITGASNCFRVGGVVGESRGNHFTIQKCANFGSLYNKGTFSSPEMNYIGGITGLGCDNSVTTGCISNGMIGDASGSSQVTIGTITARTSNPDITNCYYNDGICNVSGGCVNTGSVSYDNNFVISGSGQSLVEYIASKGSIIANPNGATLVLVVNCEVSTTFTSTTIILPSSSSSSKWYTDFECTNEFTATEIAKDTMIYAKVGSSSDTCDYQYSVNETEYVKIVFEDMVTTEEEAAQFVDKMAGGGGSSKCTVVKMDDEAGSLIAVVKFGDAVAAKSFVDAVKAEGSSSVKSVSYMLSVDSLSSVLSVSKMFVYVFAALISSLLMC